MRNARKILVEKPGDMRPFGRHNIGGRRILEWSLKLDVNEDRVDLSCSA
jgi:hypothetical protein